MITVYTALIGAYDYLRPPAPRAISSHARYVCYSDRKWPSTPPWEIVPAWLPFDGDAARNVRVHKMLSHEFAGGGEASDVSIWHDANFVMQIDPVEAAREWLRSRDIACFPHPGRSTLYDEGELCAREGYDDPTVLRAQMARYRAARFGEPWLAACGILVRRHTRRLVELNLAWWREVLNGSKRDQVSFPFVFRSYQPEFIRGQVYDNPWWKHYFHAWRKGHPHNTPFEIDPPAIRDWSAEERAAADGRWAHLAPLCVRAGQMGHG